MIGEYGLFRSIKNALKVGGCHFLSIFKADKAKSLKNYWNFAFIQA